MSTNEERIKQRFRTLAADAPLGPDRQYMRRACELLIDAMVPELNRMDRAVDAHEDRLSKPQALARNPRRMEQKDLDVLITSGRWEQDWPAGEPKPVEFGEDGKVLWWTGEAGEAERPRYFYTSDKRYLKYTPMSPFMAVLRVGGSGVAAVNPRNDLIITSDSTELLCSQLRFGPWGFPVSGGIYELFHTERGDAIKTPVATFDQPKRAFWHPRGTFTASKPEDWPPGARDQALNAVLPKRCLVVTPGGQCEGPHGHDGRHSTSSTGWTR